MSSFKTPRVVLVTRMTDLDALLMCHGTREQARFFLESRQQRIEVIEGAHRAFVSALQAVSQAIPLKWRRTRLDRSELPGFVFEPEDFILVLGQDGLVANVAKYLEGQLVLGVNPYPGRVEGLLVRHKVVDCADLLQDAHMGRIKVDERSMVEARLDDGQALLALNEIFVGHRSHQSARYRIRLGEREERHSSSGVLVATGTGATGWARSIRQDREIPWAMPQAQDPSLAFFVREAWPSPWTQRDLTQGFLEPGSKLELCSEMNEDGVIFGDGMEADRLAFNWGVRSEIQLSDRRLRLAGL